MASYKVYRPADITVMSLKGIRDYLNLTNSASLGQAWAHKTYLYTLEYPGGNSLEYVGFPQVEQAVQKHGDTPRFKVHYESTGQRLLTIDATDPTRVVVCADNKGHNTVTFLARVEELLGLKARPNRVFVTHGHSDLWLQVARFIEKGRNRSSSQYSRPSGWRLRSDGPRDGGQAISVRIKAFSLPLHTKGHVRIPFLRQIDAT